MPVYKFRLIWQPGADPFGHRNYNALAEAAVELLPLRTDLVFEETAGAEFVALDIVGDVTDHDAKAQLDMAVANAGRADMYAVHE